MNTDTGAIKLLEQLEKEEIDSGKWTPLTPDELREVEPLPAKNRPTRLKRRRRDRKRSRRAMARASRRANRQQS